MNNPSEAVRTKIEWIVVETLGDQVSRVEVHLMDHDYSLGIAIHTPSGLRHAVRCWTHQAIEQPELMAAGICDRIMAWLDTRRN